MQNYLYIYTHTYILYIVLALDGDANSQERCGSKVFTGGGWRRERERRGVVLVIRLEIFNESWFDLD